MYSRTTASSSASTDGSGGGGGATLTVFGVMLAVLVAGWVAAGLAKAVYWFDQRGIDGAINASASLTGGGGGILRLLQTGKVQQYAILIFAGTVLLVAGFIIF